MPKQRRRKVESAEPIVYRPGETVARTLFDRGRLRHDVDGIGLPPNLEDVADARARQDSDLLRGILADDGIVVPADDLTVSQMFSDAVVYGFGLAILRYREALASIPEAAAMAAKLDAGRRKGAAKIKAKAAPARKRIRKRFSELRKSGFTKTTARDMIAQEERKSVRHIERLTRGMS
jgi:hypothetical protein